MFLHNFYFSISSCASQYASGRHTLEVPQISLYLIFFFISFLIFFYKQKKTK